MPRETDPARIATLIEILRTDRGGALGFTDRAHFGHPINAEPDDLGLAALFPAETTRGARERYFRAAMAECIVDGSGKLSRLDREYGVEYELRLTYLGHKLYVKMNWDDDNPKRIELEVVSVKRQN